PNPTEHLVLLSMQPTGKSSSNRDATASAPPRTPGPRPDRRQPASNPGYPAPCVLSTRNKADVRQRAYGSPGPVTAIMPGATVSIRQRAPARAALGAARVWRPAAALSAGPRTEPQRAGHQIIHLHPVSQGQHVPALYVG